MELTDLATIRTLCEKYDFALSKGFGQNFIVNPGVPPKIVDAAGIDRRYGVLEIGPGIGVLTREIASRAGKVVAVEVDKRLPPVLQETLAGLDNVQVVLQDVLKTDLRALMAREFEGMPVVVCANLPYNITTPVITALLQSQCFQAVTVMIQREVAKRICAQPGTAEYGAFTLLCQYYAHCEVLFDVPPSCFLPAPKVTSSVIRMTVREAPPVPVGDPALFFRVVRGAFAQRRKTLINSLSSSLTDFVGKEEVTQALRACNLTETIRGERLTFADFAQLTEKLQEIRGS